MGVLIFFVFGNIWKKGVIYFVNNESMVVVVVIDIENKKVSFFIWGKEVEFGVFGVGIVSIYLNGII